MILTSRRSIYAILFLSIWAAQGLSAQDGTHTIHIPTQPACAVVNITGIASLPTEKGTNAHAWMEVRDKDSVLFKKRVLIDLNGETSTAKEKRNFSAVFCEDEWMGKETTSIKIGDWVAQDGFHFKAYHTSITKGEAPVCYKLFQKIVETNPSPRPARCFPDAFPCIVYLNGQFYGIFSWQLKKHRDNYHLSRDRADHIHLEGYLGQGDIWQGAIKWGKFKVRNPKPKHSQWTLMCQDGTAYDGDHPKELMGTNSPHYDSNDESCRNSAQTKAHIVALSQYMKEIRPYETAYQNANGEEKAVALATLKTEIEKRFSMSWMIDYLILQLFIQNGDGLRKNWQWITWGDTDGTLRWYVSPYDLDFAFGVMATTAFQLKEPAKPTYGKGTNTPARYVWDYYFDDMKKRYAELRETGIISYDTVWGLMKDWVDRVGADNYAKEAERWPEMPCNRESHISSDWSYTGKSYLAFRDDSKTKGWIKMKIYTAGAYTTYNERCYRSIKNNNIGHVPDTENSSWWKDVTIKPGLYKKGEEVFDGRCNFYQFRALTDIVVKQDDATDGRQDHLIGAPFTKFYSCYPYEGGVYDQVERIRQWIQDKIVLMDEQMGFIMS